jgi:hypothetical protein
MVPPRRTPPDCARRQLRRPRHHHRRRPNGAEARGLTQVSIQPTDPLDDGLHNAIAKATKPRVHVRPTEAGDWPGRDIYQAGIDTGNATFETDAPDETSGTAPTFPTTVSSPPTATARSSGWAALTPVSDRCAYRGVAEDGIYVHRYRHGQSIGTALLERVIASGGQAGY